MNSRFAFSLAARITFNNESSPRPRARVSTAPYTNESIPDARVVSLLFAPRARIAARAARPDRVVRIARARVASRASLSRVASTPSRVPRNTAPTHRERRRRRHRARVVPRRVVRRARRSGRSRVARAPRRRVVDRVVVVARRRLRSVPGTRRCAGSRRAFFERLWNFGI